MFNGTAARFYTKYNLFYFLLILDSKCELYCVLDVFPQLTESQRERDVVASSLCLCSLTWKRHYSLSFCQAACVWSGRRALLLLLYERNEDFHCRLVVLKAPLGPVTPLKQVLAVLFTERWTICFYESSFQRQASLHSLIRQSCGRGILVDLSWNLMRFKH